MIGIHDLIMYNKELLINNYYNFCKSNPSNNLCRKIHENTLDNWKLYLDANQFSKGKDRLETWSYLITEEPFIYIKNNSMYKFIPPKPYQYLTELKTMKKDKLYFVLSGLMVIFQVFGDGNHRTANYFFSTMTNKNITNKQFDKINQMLNDYDYSVIERKPELINEIITRLITVQEQFAGKKQKTKTRRKSKSIKFSTRVRNKIKM
jgi:hypothetical protein